MKLNQRLAILEQARQDTKEPPSVFVFSTIDVNHNTGVLIGYRVGRRAKETVYLQPGETEEALKDRAIERYKQLYPEMMNLAGRGLIMLDEIYDEEKGYCIPANS